MTMVFVDGARTTGNVRGGVDPGMTTLPLDVVMVWCMTGVTGTEPAHARPKTTAIKVNAFAMVTAMAAIVWQIAAGVDYPPVPPGLIILGVAVVVVLFVRASWARVVGIVVPLFLLIGGTIASIANDDNAIRDTGDATPFLATVVQLAAVVVALVAGVAAFRERRSDDGV